MACHGTPLICSGLQWRRYRKLLSDRPDEPLQSADLPPPCQPDIRPNRNAGQSVHVSVKWKREQQM